MKGGFSFCFSPAVLCAGSTSKRRFKGSPQADTNSRKWHYQTARPSGVNRLQSRQIAAVFALEAIAATDRARRLNGLRRRPPMSLLRHIEACRHETFRI